MVVRDISFLRKKQEISDLVRQAPGSAAQDEMMPSDAAPAPSRWTLKTIRASVDWLADYSISGVRRVLKRCGLCIRSGRVQQYSPDTAYEEKVAHLLDCLRQTALAPRTHVLVFLAEMGYPHWPQPARLWTGVVPENPPIASCGGKNNKQWRIIGALNAITGQVSYLDNYIVGRAKVIEMYHLLLEVYPHAQKIFVVQDNWSVHKHPEVCDALSDIPNIEPVWLPTYAPWLNPIEKLWRWLKVSVLKMHRFGSEWEELHARVNQFLSQFGSGSTELLRYVGLLGDSKLTLACKQT